MAGQDESAFVRVHDAEYIRASKRPHLTATPRVYAPDVKDNAQRKDLVLASMDDESVYGSDLCRLEFGRAVEHGLLTNYKALVHGLRGPGEPHPSELLRRQRRPRTG